MKEYGPVLVLLLAAVCAAQNQPLQVAIPNVIEADAKVELVQAGFQALEGPIATPDAGLYFSDVAANRTYKLEADGTIGIWRENTHGANGLFLMRDGRLLCAESGAGRVVAVSTDHSVTTLAIRFAGRPLRAPNDLISDRAGGIYFTDPMPRPAPNVAPKERGNVYYLRPDGTLVLLDETIQRPNGLTLSLDERTLYVDDTEGDRIYAFDLLAGGRVANKRPFAALRDLERGSLGMRSRADGMAIDSEGRLYIGTSSGVQVIAQNGQHLGTILVPAVARNIAFAGPGRRMLYMTTLEALYRVPLLSHGPDGRSK